jgi:hypothetical protein
MPKIKETNFLGQENRLAELLPVIPPIQQEARPNNAITAAPLPQID